MHKRRANHRWWPRAIQNPLPAYEQTQVKPLALGKHKEHVNLMTQ